MSNCLKLNWIRDNVTERDTEAVMYFDTCLLLRLIGHQCDPGNMRAMASDENTLNTINIGCCWPLVVISTLIVPHVTLVTSHTDNIRGLAWRQWASWPSAQALRYHPEFINPCISESPTSVKSDFYLNVRNHRCLCFNHLKILFIENVWDLIKRN